MISRKSRKCFLRQYEILKVEKVKKLFMGISGVVLVAFAISLAGCTMHAATFGLSPEYPRSLKRVWPGYPVGTEEIISTKIDTVEPTFRWEAFPTKRDLRSQKPEIRDALSRITNVTYDLKIFRAENDYPAELIYSRQGLPEPRHKIETPLETCTKYFWSVRARFKLDNKIRVTGWSVYFVSDVPENPWYSSHVPNPYFYLFQTPCPKPESERDSGTLSR
jgi:hypothetical protein